jgi:hypothetical protein
MILKIQGSAIDVVINHQGARDKLINTISKINKEQIGQLLSSIGDEIEKGYTKYTSNPCMISYSSGQGIFVVVSLFVGAGQANGARTFLQTLEKLDVAGQLIGKVFRVGGKFLKPILNPISKKIKFALAEGVQFAQRIEFKLPNNLYCGIPYLEIKLRDRLKTLTANEIKKLEDDIARQLNDPNIPVDENGNKLLELDIDGEKVPAVVGTNEGLNKIDDGVSVNGAGSVGKYSLTAIKSEIGFVNLVADLIKKEGLSLDDFKYMMQKNVNALTEIEKSKLANIRNALSKPNANTVMQKVITKNDIQKYLNGDYNNVGGFVSRATDAKHLETFEDLYHGLRLDYNKTTFFIEDGSCGVIRFKSSNSSNAIIPSGGTYDAWDYPFTATGFTSGKSGRLGVPEWHLQNRVDFSEGAEIWQVSNNGTEKLIATYDETLKKFIAK